MSQFVVFQKLFNLCVVLVGVVLFVVFGLVGCSGMGMGMGGLFMLLVVKVINGMFMDQYGMVFYMFDCDVMVGKSVCNGKCVENWLLLVVNDVDKLLGDYIIIMCDDGKKQWVYCGKLFYFWIKDKMFGDQIGDGFMNVWYIVKL